MKTFNNIEILNFLLCGLFLLIILLCKKDTNIIFLIIPALVIIEMYISRLFAMFINIQIVQNFISITYSILLLYSIRIFF